MHNQFRDINDRLWIMGDYAEDQFKAYCDKHKIVALPFGMNRPPFNFFPQLPHVLRAMPDFLCETGHERFTGLLPRLEKDSNPSRHFLCEVKGCGKDATFKIKDEAIDALDAWQQITQRPVMFFFYDQPQQRVAFSVSLDNLKTFLPSLARGHFVDRGKTRPFYKLPTKHPILLWEDACAPAGSSISTAASATL